MVFTPCWWPSAVSQPGRTSNYITAPRANSRPSPASLSRWPAGQKRWSVPMGAQKNGARPNGRAPLRGNEAVLTAMYAEMSRRPPPSRPFLNLLCSLCTPAHCAASCERSWTVHRLVSAHFLTPHGQRRQPPKRCPFPRFGAAVSTLSALGRCQDAARHHRAMMVQESARLRDCRDRRW